jgi:hypothetical protein
LGPVHPPLFGHLIDKGQQQQMAFDQDGPGALIAAIFGRPPAHLGPFVWGNSVEPVFALFTASQYPGSVKGPGDAMAIGFTAPAAEQVKGPLDHGIGALEPA